MRIHTDDEVYRVDQVWLGPPKATFPWRARYSAYGIWIVMLMAVMWIERKLGLPFGFFSTAWAVVIAVVLTRGIGRLINHERPLTAVAALVRGELRAPREQTRTSERAFDVSHVRVQARRPRPRPRDPWKGGSDAAS